MRKDNRIKKSILCMCLVLIFSCSSSFAASSAKEKLTVGVPVNRCPVFYIDEDTEEVVGIGADLIKEVAEAAGYDVVFEIIKEQDLKHALDNDTYDILVPFGSAIKSAKGRSTVISDCIFQTPFTLLTENGKTIPLLNDLRVGMLTSLGGVAETIKEMYPGIEIIKYDTLKDSIKALRAGEVHALLNNSYVWSYVLQKSAYSDLKIQASAVFSMDFTAGAIDIPENRTIIERLNAGIATITDEKRQTVILDYTTRRLYHKTFSDLFYDYWKYVLVGTILFFFIITTVVYRLRMFHMEKEKELQKMIDIDPLTGLYNFSGFKKKVAELIQANPDLFYMVSYNDIADFKYINDNFGRSTGDDILKFWADKSLAAITDEEVMGRIDSDHFVSFVTVGGLEKIHSYDESVFTPLRNYFIDRGKEVKVRVCSGVYVLMPEDYRNIDVDKMIDCARVAEKKAHAAKVDGYEVYNPSQWEKGKRIAGIVHRLPLAIQTEELKVWYQPQVDYVTGKITGAEALCRWNHSELGWISPGEFIPALEDAGLIYDLDCFVWERVCKDLSKWEKEGFHRIVSVNVSRIDIQKNKEIPEFFRDLIKKYELEPKQLHVEITESAYVEDPEILISTTSRLREYGFTVEMDDFGSGYSSLNMLKEVPVDRIKMDLKFLTETGNAEMGRTIITHLVAMLRELGMSIIAEGVETKEQAEFLKSRDLTEMQGYLFYKPMPIDELEEKMK